MNTPYIHPWQALIVAVLVATAYTYGGLARVIAALIILAVFVAPAGPTVSGPSGPYRESLLEALGKYLTDLVAKPF